MSQKCQSLAGAGLEAVCGVHTGVNRCRGGGEIHCLDAPLLGRRRDKRCGLTSSARCQGGELFRGKASFFGPTSHTQITRSQKRCFLKLDKLLCIRMNCQWVRVFLDSVCMCSEVSVQRPQSPLTPPTQLVTTAS